MDPGHLEKSVPPGVSEALVKGAYWGKQTLTKMGRNRLDKNQILNGGDQL